MGKQEENGGVRSKERTGKKKIAKKTKKGRNGKGRNIEGRGEGGVERGLSNMKQSQRKRILKRKE